MAVGPEASDEELRAAIARLVDSSLQHFTQKLDFEMRGISSERVTKALAEYDPTGEWLDAWTEFVADS